jgi:hypothetical protein
MAPDQGLRYELAGIIGAAEALAAMAAAHPDARVIPLDVDQLALLPVMPELAADVTPAALCVLGLDVLPGGTPLAARRRAELLTGPESGFGVLTPGLVALLEACSTIGTVGYVEADYHGREGSQAAAVWRSGVLVSGPLLLGRQEAFAPGSAPISVALRILGVTAPGRLDEFVVAGLGRHRRTRDWIAAQG